MAAASSPTPDEVASALYLSIGLFLRRLRQAKSADGELSMPQSSVLTRLDREGPRASADLARSEQISAQSMGTTLSALAARALIERRPDVDDGRRTVISISAAGRKMLRSRRSARAASLSAALETEFSDDELVVLLAAAPLIERLAQRI